MMRRLVLLAVLLLAATAEADDYERIEGRLLADLPGSPAAERREALTFGDLAGLPTVLEGSRSALVIATTDRGNPARLLVAPGFFKDPGADGDAEPVPILILERFDTFEAGGGSAPNRLATGRSVFLFDGFAFDLDAGQVVPEGLGGDLAFRDAEEGEPRLVPIGEAAIYTLTAAPEFPEAAEGRPSPGREILPGDYAGRYRLDADGEITGVLDLAVDGRDAKGKFRSDETGNVYDVRGTVEEGRDPLLRFTIRYPRSEHEFTGRLFRGDKGAMAGSALLLDQEAGFFAIREGGTNSEEEATVASPPG